MGGGLSINIGNNKEFNYYKYIYIYKYIYLCK
jgi:hypothetical protein